jgi:hypothetical protein
VGAWGGFNKQRDDGYRAIGRYVAVFSELVSEMRQQVALHGGGDGLGGKRMVAVEIALGETPAMSIAHAFFGLARRAGDYTSDEAKIANRLAKQVEDAIQTRNDIAHGDWEVGVRAPPDTPPEAAHRLMRILPHRKEGPYKAVVLTAADIDAMSDKLLDLLAVVMEFGKLALGLPLTGTDRQVTKGEFRVGDVFVLRGGKGTTTAEIVREGPRADAVLFLPYR